jgi:hypothetical protein
MPQGGEAGEGLKAYTHHCSTTTNTQTHTHILIVLYYLVGLDGHCMHLRDNRAPWANAFTGWV